jgi:NitT/TauT family transport system ATP-binding protein
MGRGCCGETPGGNRLPASLAHAPAPAPRPTLLELDHVSQTYRTRDGGSVHAVDGVSCTIEQGEFVALLGPSGCGKSTLLTMIAGLLRPTSGRILHRGEPLAGPQVDVGMVFQDAVLFPWRTVLENVELPGEISGMPSPARRRRALELLETVGLTGFERKLPSELSGGMQQRVAIARALMRDPSLILMDEPFGALDAMTREQMNLEVQRIGMETGATFVFVTHSIAEAAFLADRVFVMTGRPADIREIVPIDLPRPRPLDIISTDRFGVYVKRLRALFDAEVR